MIKEIQNYFDSILNPQLSKYGVSDVFQRKITDTIFKQMYSVIINWDEPEFIKTLFLTVSEEAPFYKPNSDSGIKSFVVLTIRNSPIETLQSDNYAIAGLPRRLSDEQIIEVTSSAIEYFSKIDFSEAINENYNVDDDVYYIMSQKYRIAWNALSNVTNAQSCSGVFQGLQYKVLPDHLNIKLNESDRKHSKIAVIDGYDPATDEELLNQLSSIINNKGVLIVDCFKMLSRNLDKILFTLELLLQNQCHFMTTNYYIENGYFEKREKIIKAASSTNATNDTRKHFSNFTGVGKVHKKYLIAAQEGYSICE